MCKYELFQYKEEVLLFPGLCSKSKISLKTAQNLVGALLLSACVAQFTRAKKIVEKIFALRWRRSRLNPSEKSLANYANKQIENCC